MVRFFLKYELIKLFRHSWQLLAFGLIVFIGFLAIGYGKTEVAKQHAILGKIQEDQKKGIEDLRLGFLADTTQEEGSLAYQKVSNPAMMGWYMQLYTVNPPQGLSALSLGVRDLFPFYLKLKPYSLYMQIFQDEISNPLKLFAGNFDLGFVIIYLLPILIIAIGYNLLSEEKEQGTLDLWMIHGVSAKKMLQWKILFYFVSLNILTFVMTVIGFWLSSVSIPTNFIAFSIWLIASWMYVGFWFALVLLVISFNKNSATNAVLLAVVWLLILMVYPSTVNLLSSIAKPVKNQHLSDVIRRYTIEENDETIKKYLHLYESRHPEYNPIDTTSHPNNLSKAYISFHESLDEKHGKIIETYFDAIKNRISWGNKLNILNPAVHMAQVFNHLGSTEFDTYQAFFAQTKAFHSEMKQFFHPQLFKNEHMEPNDFDHIPQFKFNTPAPSFKALLMKLLIIIFIGFGLFSLALRNLDKKAKS